MPFAPGKYRLVMIFQKRPSDDVSTWKWLLADSNEFEIVK
jgi:predicted neutral ceramidase superfamily lipid hydrolase